jgi:hypothetical protein
LAGFSYPIAIPTVKLHGLVPGIQNVYQTELEPALQANRGLTKSPWGASLGRKRPCVSLSASSRGNLSGRGILLQPHQTNHGNRVRRRAADSIASAKPAHAGQNIPADVGCVRTKCNVRIVRRLRDYEGISRQAGITALDH